MIFKSSRWWRKQKFADLGPSNKKAQSNKMNAIREDFPESPNCTHYHCLYCHTPIATSNNLLSKSFQGSSGKALLTRDAFNVRFGTVTNRQLITGLHSVVDVYCGACSSTLGWKYIYAFEKEQKYKEGLIVLERGKLMKDDMTTFLEMK